MDGDDLLPHAYRANVWGSHSGDEVIRRELAVRPGQTVIDLASDVDHIGFSVYRTVDGQCVDLMEAHLIMEVNVGMEVVSGSTMNIRTRPPVLNYKVTPRHPTSMISVRSDHESAELDKGIRRLWLERQLFDREAVTRRERSFVRFQPEEFKQAVQHITYLIRQGSHRLGPLYLADPYFDPYLDDTAAKVLGACAVLP